MTPFMWEHKLCPNVTDDLISILTWNIIPLVSPSVVHHAPPPCSVLLTTRYNLWCTLLNQTDKDNISRLTFSNSFKLWNADFGQLVVIYFFLSGFKSWTSLDKTKYRWNLKTHFDPFCCFCRSLYMMCAPINVSTAWFMGERGEVVCVIHYREYKARLSKSFPSKVHKTPVQQHF